jgi:hypothetical protein
MDAPAPAHAASRSLSADYTRKVAAGGGDDPMPLDFRGFPRWRAWALFVHEAAIQWLPMLLALLGAGANVNERDSVGAAAAPCRGRAADARA